MIASTSAGVEAMRLMTQRVWGAFLLRHAISRAGDLPTSD
jgi:hypothetical protein